MKTAEFVDKITRCGYNVVESDRVVELWERGTLNVEDEYIGNIHKDVISIDLAMTTRQHGEIGKIVSEYLATPLRDRVKELRYHLELSEEYKQVLSIDCDSGFLNYDTKNFEYNYDTKESSMFMQTIFTSDEIKNMPKVIRQLHSVGVLVKVGVA